MHTGDDVRAGSLPPVAGDSTAPCQDGPVPCLGVVHPRGLNRCFKLGVAPRTIGSGQNADIVLNDDRIAPVHCRVSLSGGDVLVEDLGSPAGTLVDEQRIASARLVPGQRLQIGHYRFMLGQCAAEPRERVPALDQWPGTDRVTGIPNRAWILRRAEAMLEARADSPRPVTLALLAVDRLDAVQDRHGYQAADQLLRQVGRLVEGHLREREVLGLNGVEKFLLLLPEVDPVDVGARLRRLCRMVRLERFEYAGREQRVTLSIGYATRAGAEVESLDRFLTHAEHALYRARRWGGDQVITLDPQ